MKNLTFIGGGLGFREVLPILQRSFGGPEKPEILGILDDNESLAGQSILGYPVLGPISSWDMLPEDTFFVHAIGNFTNRGIRAEIVRHNKIPIDRFFSVIDPSATVDTSFEKIGNGVIFHPGVVVSAGATIGNFVTISANSVIGVDNFVGPFALVAAGVNTATGVEISEGVFLGTGVSIAPGVKMGAYSMAAVGSVVLRNVPDKETVYGNPARPMTKAEP